VDAITDPPTSTVDYLAIAAKSGDPQLFAYQVNNIQTLTATLQEIAHNATMGYISVLVRHIHLCCPDICDSRCKGKHCTRCLS